MGSDAKVTKLIAFNRNVHQPIIEISAMKRITCTLLFAGCLFGAGCSKPTAEAPTPATPTPAAKSERELEQNAAAQRKKEEATVHAEARPAEAVVDKPINAASPSASASPTP